MPDVYNLVVDFLLDDPGMAAIVEDRIFIDTMLPTGYKITDGDCLVIRPTGGIAPHYALTSDNVMFLSYSTTAQGAIDLNEAMFTAFRRTDNPAELTVFYAQPQQRGSLIRQPGDMYTMMATYLVATVIG